MTKTTLEKLATIAELPEYQNGIDIDEIKNPEHIKAIQSALTLYGRPIAIDGIAGWETKANWMNFKKENHQRWPEMVGRGSLHLLANSIKKSNLVDPDRKIFYELTPIRRVYMSLIAWCEGTDKTLDPVWTGYNIRYGYVKFDDYSRFPPGYITRNGITSSASGRYQIMDFTWKHIQGALNFPSFEPQYQDQSCLWLLHVARNALRFVDGDDLDRFCWSCSWEWASIPPDRYGQSAKSKAQVEWAHKQLKEIYL